SALLSLPITLVIAQQTPDSTSSPNSASSSPPAAGAVTDSAAAATQAPPPASPTGEFSTEQLEQLVAPIALYPDSLLTQILMASTYPLEIVEADRFMKKNTGLTGDALNS